MQPAGYRPAQCASYVYVVVRWQRANNKQRCLDETNRARTVLRRTSSVSSVTYRECHWTSRCLLARVFMPTQTRICRCDFCSKSISQEDRRCKLSCDCVTCVGCLLKKHSLRGARQLVYPKCKCVVTFAQNASVSRYPIKYYPESNVVYYPQGNIHPVDKLRISS